MNIILFGPPGIGKSTIIGALKTRGWRAIDLEDIYPSKVRFQLPNQVDEVILGGADLDPKRSYPNSKKVLLFMEQDAYEQRRMARDAQNKSKAKQTAQKVDDWLTGNKFDLVINVTYPINEVLPPLERYARAVLKSSNRI